MGEIPKRILIDPKKQFSKRLARWTAVFWFLYMTWLSVVMLLEPQSAIFSVYMGIICTVVMIVSVVSYTHNSVMEKLAFAMIDKAMIDLSLPKSSEKKDESEVSNG